MLELDFSFFQLVKYNFWLFHHHWRVFLQTYNCFRQEIHSLNQCWIALSMQIQTVVLVPMCNVTKTLKGVSRVSKQGAMWSSLYINKKEWLPQVQSSCSVSTSQLVNQSVEVPFDGCPPIQIHNAISLSPVRHKIELASGI